MADAILNVLVFTGSATNYASALQLRNHNVGGMLPSLELGLPVGLILGGTVGLMGNVAMGFCAKTSPTYLTTITPEHLLKEECPLTLEGQKVISFHI